MRSQPARARRANEAIAATCDVCRGAKQPDEDICRNCQRRVVSICRNETSPTDKLITRALRERTAKQREKLISKSGHGGQEAKKRFQSKLEVYKKKIDALRQQARRNLQHPRTIKVQGEVQSIVDQKPAEQLEKKGRQNSNIDKQIVTVHTETDRDMVVSPGQSDYTKLAALLRNKQVVKDLPNLTSMARLSSTTASRHSRYKALCDVFCDGFEYSLGQIKR